MGMRSMTKNIHYYTYYQKSASTRLCDVIQRKSTKLCYYWDKEVQLGLDFFSRRGPFFSFIYIYFLNHFFVLKFGQVWWRRLLIEVKWNVHLWNSMFKWQVHLNVNWLFSTSLSLLMLNSNFWIFLFPI